MGGLIYNRASTQGWKTWLAWRLVRYVPLGNDNLNCPTAPGLYDWCQYWDMSFYYRDDFRICVCTLAVSDNPILEIDDSRLSGILFVDILDCVDIWWVWASWFALVDFRPDSFLPFSFHHCWWKVLGGKERIERK